MTPRFWPGQRKDGAVISCGRSSIQYCHVELGPDLRQPCAGWG